MLTENGNKIYLELAQHCTETMSMLEIDHYSLECLANALDVYQRCAKVLNREGMTQVAKTGFLTQRPELAIQKDAYDKILRASAQFGLTPGSRRKVFMMKPIKKKSSLLEGLD